MSAIRKTINFQKLLKKKTISQHLKKKNQTMAEQI